MVGRWKMMMRATRIACLRSLDYRKWVSEWSKCYLLPHGCTSHSNCDTWNEQIILLQIISSYASFHSDPKPSPIFCFSFLLSWPLTKVVRVFREPSGSFPKFSSIWPVIHTVFFLIIFSTLTSFRLCHFFIFQFPFLNFQNATVIWINVWEIPMVRAIQKKYIWSGIENEKNGR